MLRGCRYSLTLRRHLCRQLSVSAPSYDCTPSDRSAKDAAVGTATGDSSGCALGSGRGTARAAITIPAGGTATGLFLLVLGPPQVSRADAASGIIAIERIILLAAREVVVVERLLLPARSAPRNLVHRGKWCKAGLLEDDRDLGRRLALLAWRSLRRPQPVGADRLVV